MGDYENGWWLNAVNVVLVVLAIVLAVSSAHDVVGAILGGGF